MQRGIIRKTDFLGRVTIPKEYLLTVPIEKGKHVLFRKAGNGFKITNSDSVLCYSIDKLGRICIPSKLREEFGIAERSTLEIRCYDTCIYISLPGVEAPDDLEGED